MKANGPFKTRTSGTVYVFRDVKNNLLKIGGTSMIGKRFHTISLQRKSKLIHIVSIPCEKFMQLEKFLHSQLKADHLGNELYPDDPRILRTIIDFVNKHGDLFGAHSIWFHAPGKAPQ